MTTLKIALAQSPLRAATAETTHGTAEVRALMIDRYTSATGANGQTTWTGAWRHCLYLNGVPSWQGSRGEIEDAAAHLTSPSGGALDWQPVWQREQPTVMEQLYRRESH